MSSVEQLVASAEFRKDAERVFFAASRENGYAFDTHSGKPYVSGSWEVSDEWRGNDVGPFSRGETQIFYAGTLVWAKQYYGWYAKATIACLKAALRDAYSKSVFFGGRGPRMLVHKDMVYRNDPFYGESRFELFRGKEQIYRLSQGESTKMGFHWYHGGFMLNTR